MSAMWRHVGWIDLLVYTLFLKACPRTANPFTLYFRNDEGSHKTKYRKESITFTSTACPNVKPPGRLVLHPKATLKTGFNPFSYCNAPTPSNVHRQALLASGISFGERSASAAYFGIISSTLAQSVDTALYAPALACYTLWRGRQDDNSSMIDASQQLYVHGLIATQRALTDVKLAQADSTYVSQSTTR